MTKKCEILAPCGSYEILVAAIKAGADACYLGGSKFGARAFADNFDHDTLIKAIDYAHLHDVNIYLTVNTLFKNDEIEALYEYIKPLYEAGLDAVIVQDLGVFSCVKKYFPDMHIHCSTQMNITSINAAKMMYENGASRIVTAREMSLDEIRCIKNELPDLEIESFVHGALCYSYSGQCLMSSLAGGRSGNRGRCAQPCRKCYGDKYILSMKDMCTLNKIPNIIEAGIDSLKIEGRMKNEYYVASAVDAYRELRDDYYKGCFNENKAAQYKYRLANIFNRGGFCGGYYYVHNGRDMISTNRPNNQGVNIGKVTGAKNGKVFIKLAENLYKQDVLEIPLNDNSIIEITSGIDGEANKVVELNCPKTKQILNGSTIYRTRCNKIINDIDVGVLSSDKKKSVDCSFLGKIGRNMKLSLETISMGEKLRVDVEGDIVELSEKFTIDEAQIISKINQLGDTYFCFENIDIDIDSNAFLPVGMIKRLRREAICQLEEKITERYCRRTSDDVLDIRNIEADNYCLDKDNVGNQRGLIMVSVSNIDQFNTVINYAIYGIQIDIYIYRQLTSAMLDSLNNKGIKIFVELPNIVRNDFNIVPYLNDDSIYGFVVKNIDSFALLNKNKIFDKEIILSSSFYAYNNEALDFIEKSNGRYIFEIPKELNNKELDSLRFCDRSFTIYEYQQVMLSAQCVRKTTEGCNKNYAVNAFVDDKGNKFYYMAKCDECCNIIYNGVPYCNTYCLNEQYINDMNIRYIKLSFSVEDIEKIDKIMRLIDQNKIYELSKDQIREVVGETTAGHFYRGVD